ncbi:MAG: hypothetical protein JOZ47_01525 [Kutzneria sp.]|nr:hypothetical protein [Kutzneria sp.]MBV9843742.1 hypothetical protein [Kutzneria sp.]
MYPRVARELIADLGGVRARTRLRLSAFWFPLCLFGVTTTGVGLLGLAAGPDVLGWGLMVNAIVGTVAVWAWFRRRSRRIGLGGRSRSYLATAIVGTGLCAVAGMLVPTRPTDAAPWLACAGTYLVFAWLERSPPILLLAGVIAAVSFGACCVPAQPRDGVVTVVGSMVYLGTGLALRHRGTRSHLSDVGA